MKRTLLILVTALSTSCVTHISPAPAPVRDAIAVRAAFDETWNAAIDHFASQNAPIATIEKASGIIATSPMRVGEDDALEFADCGGRKEFFNQPIQYPAARVVYNVLVRSSGAYSSVRVTAAWSSDVRECATRGVWESRTEAAIRIRAEAGSARIASDE